MSKSVITIDASDANINITGANHIKDIDIMWSLVNEMVHNVDSLTDKVDNLESQVKNLTLYVTEQRARIIALEKDKRIQSKDSEDSKSSSSQKKSKVTYECGICGEIGHSRRTCPYK